MRVLLLLGVAALRNCDEPRDFDSMTADCRKVAHEYPKQMKRGIEAGTVSAQAEGASGFADRSAAAAGDAADHATTAASNADAVGGTLPEGAADDAEAAATEASDAATAATTASVDAATAVGDVNSKIDAKESHTVTVEELKTAKDAIKEAVKAGHTANAKAAIAHEQAEKAEAATEKAVGEAGAATVEVATAARDAKVSSDKAVKVADGSAAKAHEESAYATEVADKIEAKFNLTADPVTSAVVSSLRYDADNTTTAAEAAEAAADAVETAWADAESAETPVATAVSNQEPHTATADEVAALKDALDVVAETEKNATTASEDAEYFAEKAYEAAKKEEQVRLLDAPPPGSVMYEFLAKPK